MKAIIFSITLTILTISTYGSWTQDQASFSKFFSVKNKDPFVNTSLPICKVKNSSAVRGSAEVKYLKLKNEKYLAKDFEVKLLEESKRSDLIVILPGIFSGIDEDKTKRLTSLFYEKNAHILVFPSPVTPEFLASGLRYPMISPEVEAEIFKKGIFDIAELLGDKIKNIKLVSWSYGAFLTSIIAAKNSSSAKPLPITSYTLFSPPFNLDAAFSKIDRLIEKAKSPYTPVGLWKLMKIKKKLCSNKSDLSFSIKDLKRVQDLVSYVGFRSGLKKAIKSYIRNNEVEYFTKGFGKKYFFREYLVAANPQANDWLKSPKGSTEYWLKKTSHFKNQSFRILVSEDDFLNNRLDWRESESVIVLKSGGHYGVSAYKWFETFIKISF